MYKLIIDFSENLERISFVFSNGLMTPFVFFLCQQLLYKFATFNKKLHRFFVMFNNIIRHIKKNY